MKQKRDHYTPFNPKTPREYAAYTVMAIFAIPYLVADRLRTFSKTNLGRFAEGIAEMLGLNENFLDEDN